MMADLPRSDGDATGWAMMDEALAWLSCVVAAAQGIAGHADAIVSAVGGLLAIYGRVTATKVIKR
ncbi:hypothetical protein [Salipiger profundus]